MNKTGLSRTQLGLRMGVTYLVLPVMVEWREFHTSDWGLILYNLMWLLAESIVAATLFALAFPPFMRFLTRRKPT